MRKSWIAFLLVGMLAGSTAYAEEWTAEGVSTLLKRQFPRFDFSKVEQSPVEGLWAVYGAQNLTYYAPKTGHIFVGNLWSPDGKNLTEIAMSEQVKDKFSALDMNKALKIGNGPKIMIEVTDPDCPYCRQGSSLLEARNDITRYIFFMPLPMHKDAPAKSKYILSAADPIKAYKEVFSGKFDQQPLPVFSDNGMLDEHVRMTSQLGLRGTPFYMLDNEVVTLTHLQADVSKQVLENLPLEMAVKIGNGPNTVIEVTDPDCPYCRKGSEFFDQRSDVTRYVFFMPLPNHKNAPAKARYILSAKDQAKAYEEVFSGKFDQVPVPEVDDQGLLSEHMRIASMLGVRGTPAYWANGTQVSGLDTNKLNQLLSK